MLVGLAAVGATMDHFNPYYGLVVSDSNDPDLLQRRVVVLWEDGMERVHFRNDLMAWTEAPAELRKP